MKEIKHIQIKSKDIYIFESHHYALSPWAELRNTLSKAPILISFDHHLDYVDPFAGFIYNQVNLNKTKLRTELLNEINFSDKDTIEMAISKLKHNEQIETAIATDIINKALVISFNNHDIPEPIEPEKISIVQRLQKYRSELENIPRSYIYPEANIYFPKITPRNTNLANYKLDDDVIETKFLRDKFDVFHEMCPKIIHKNHSISEKYILDIDLDYFHTVKSMNPEDPQFLYQIIQNSEIITIALEPGCVELESNGNVNSEQLLEKLLQHIENAL